MATISWLMATIAAEVGASCVEPGSSPPQLSSRTKNTQSTHGDSVSPPSRASVETMPIVPKPRRLASS